MKDKEIIRQVDLILERVGEIDRERKEWEQKLLDIFPIKIGEKVSVYDKDGFVRYVIVSRIKMYFLNHLNGEYITKIK